MAIGWKVLIPVSIVWILLIATVRAWRLDSHTKAPYVVFGFVVVLIVLLATMWESSAQQRAARYAASEEASEAEAGRDAPFGTGSFPVPPLDLPHYRGIGIDVDRSLEQNTSTREVTGA
jgi:NADH-quinone oxidoreductase subunit H